MCSKYLLMIAIFLTGSCQMVFSQTDNEDISDLLDDGGISEAKNVLKFDLLTPFAGEFSLAYERVVSSKLSIEVAGGKILSSYLFDFDDVLEFSFDELDDLSGGFAFRVSPRFYWNNTAPEYFYLSPSLKYRRFNIDTEDFDIAQRGIMIMAGYNKFFTERLVFEYASGIGYNRLKFISNDENPVQTPIIPLGGMAFKLVLKIGYIF